MAGSRSPLARAGRLLATSGRWTSAPGVAARRLRWRLHWLVSSRPIVLGNWSGDLSISLPRSGSAAHVFYARGPGEPPLAAELVARLPPGGVFVDVGAHIGVYSLIAARAVGAAGRVFAVEPQAACCTHVRTNVDLNRLTNVVVVQAAAGDADGAVSFATNSRSMGGMVAAGGNSVVPMVRLDTFAREHQLDTIDVLKLDAAGNEHAALVGADALLRARRLPAILCKLYQPAVVAQRFGHDASLVVERLLSARYVVSALPSEALPARAVDDPADVPALFDGDTYARTLLAIAPGG